MKFHYISWNLITSHEILLHLIESRYISLHLMSTGQQTTYSYHLCMSCEILNVPVVSRKRIHLTFREHRRGWLFLDSAFEQRTAHNVCSWNRHRRAVAMTKLTRSVNVSHGSIVCVAEFFRTSRNPKLDCIHLYSTWIIMNSTSSSKLRRDELNRSTCCADIWQHKTPADTKPQQCHRLFPFWVPGMSRPSNGQWGWKDPFVKISSWISFWLFTCLRLWRRSQRFKAYLKLPSSLKQTTFQKRWHLWESQKPPCIT